MKGLRVGLTGGIGSGKSTAGKAFQRLGRTLLSADEIARTISDTDPAVKREIRKFLGPAAYLPDGRVDRKYVASRVFSNPRLLARLNAAVHPRVFKAIESTLSRLPQSKQFPYVLVEAALIFESGMERGLDYVITVDAPLDLRLRRVEVRDKVSRVSVRRRMRSQMPGNVKRRLSSFVLENRGTKTTLVKNVALLDSILTSIALGRKSSDS